MFYNLSRHITVMKKITFNSSYDNSFSSCAVEKKEHKLTENIGKYVPPNIDDLILKIPRLLIKILTKLGPL